MKVLLNSIFSSFQNPIIVVICTILLMTCKEKDFTTYYNDGIENYKDYNYEKAITQFKNSLERNPNNEQIYQRMAAAYKESNALNGGIEYFKSTIKSNPDNAYLHYGLGLIFLEKKEFNKAIEKFKITIDLKPQFTKPTALLIETYKKTDSLYIAKQFFSEMIGKQPNNPFAYYGLAYTYRKQYQQDQAFQNIDKALNLIHDEKAFIYLKAKLFSDIGEYDKAINVADSGLKILSENDYDFRNTLLINKSANYWYEGENKKAIEHLKEVLQTSRLYGNVDHELQALNLIGLVYRATDQPNEALDIYKYALQIVDKRGFQTDKGIFLGNIGDIYLTVSQYDSALVYLRASQEKLEEIKDIKNLAATYSSIAIAYSSQAKYDEALKYGDKAIKICQAIGDPFGEAIELINFGVIQVELGNYFKALDYITQALNISRETGQKYNEQICLANIGEIYSNLGNYKKAKKYLELSNKIALEIDSKGEVATNNAALGTIYLAMGDTTIAIQYLDQALEIFIEISDKSNEATTCANIAKIHTEQKKYDRAKNYFEKSLQINQEIGNKFGESNTLIDYGNLYFAINNYSKAIELYKQSLKIGNNIRIKEVIARANFGIGCSLKEQNKIVEAIDYYKEAITAVENIRDKLRLAEYKSGFLEKKINFYNELIDLYYQLYQKSGNKDFVEQSYQYAERAKARALLDVLEESRINIQQGIDSLLLNRQEKIRREIANLQTQLSSTELSDEQKDELYEKINQSEQEFNDLQFEIKQKNPAYANLKYPEPISVKDIQKMLPGENSGLLEYSLGENNSYLWIIIKDKVYFHQLATEKEIIEKVEKYLSVITSSLRAGASLDIPGKELYDLLLRPVEQQLSKFKNIIIIPDGILHYLPFEALITGTENNLPHYFVETHIINYAPSASVYDFIKNRKYKEEVTKKTDLIAFADPVYGKSEEKNKITTALQADQETMRGTYNQRGFNFNRLRYSAEEVKGIASHFSDEGASVFLREDAKEEKVKSSILILYNKIHFATHALIDEELPGRSCIVLTLDEDPAEDGFLRMNEILNLKLEADLVTLSACQTGRGKLVRGEGIIGLTRAFLYAGASSLVVSHWPVSDFSTAQFMEKFYGFMQQGNSKSESLRKAKLDFINNKIPKNRHPYYWAAFILTGAK